MSTQVMQDRWALSSSSFRTVSDRAGDSEPVVRLSQVPFDLVYQALYAPESEPEEILRELYLLECD
jgi:hypothetical protein